jgi:hypothetical protein
VHVQPQVVVAVEEVLAPRVGGVEDAPVQQAGAVLETALRAVGRDGLALQQTRVAAGESVDGVSLWHAPIVADDAKPDVERRPASMDP